MSSTNRGARRLDFDYYRTPVRTVQEMIAGMLHFEPDWLNKVRTSHILDPCAGGDPRRPEMPYPTVLTVHGCTDITTVDIREDSSAQIKCDFFSMAGRLYYNMVVSNPPFDLAHEFITTGLEFLKPDGYLIYLLRLSFYGAQKRRAFWKDNLPKYTIVHSTRPNFMPGGTDSAEYAHFVWKKGERVDSSRLIVV